MDFYRLDKTITIITLTRQATSTLPRGALKIPFYFLAAYWKIVQVFVSSAPVTRDSIVLDE